ncbi:20168_t:CDS:2 [Funneliformis geosporum]|uniref:4785_t:CDS:1 n=4 Tax=Glomeraceae TaxID=36751 RepID=A0A9W4SSV1_9GLOM|nr:20168_t:CDS:2 [Funneliformis geosporum]CAI2179614.1 4785_t:CDS:2 [Funneliformis geosporum]
MDAESSLNSTDLKIDSTKEDVPTDTSATSSSGYSINPLQVQLQTEQLNSRESTSNKTTISNPSNLISVSTTPSQVPEINTSPPGELTPQNMNFSSQDINLLTPNLNRTISSSPTLSPVNYNSDSSNLASPSTPLSSQKGSPTSGLYNSFTLNSQEQQTTTGQPQSPSPVKAKPYACTECNQTFSRQHNLKSHALTHSQEKPFQCEVCQHFFRRHHDLKRHAKLHTGEKPYQCPHCKRSFARLDALNRHLRAESFCGGPQKKLYQTSTNGQKLSQQKTEQKVEQPQKIQSQPQQQQPLPPPQQKKKQIDKNLVLNVESQVNKSPTLQSESLRQSQENFQEQFKHWHQQIQMQKSPSNLNNSTRIGQIVFPVDSVTKATSANIQRYSIQYAQDSQQRIVDDPIKIDPDVDTIIINRRTTAMSQLEIQLKERNDYLEDRVRQLENEVINERKLRNRRELLEEQVRKLEIEKNLLKSLLLERSNRGPTDLGPTGGPGGGYDVSSIELAKRSDKKRKASYLGDLSSSPKHQKDYDGAAVIPQSAQ